MNYYLLSCRSGLHICATNPLPLHCFPAASSLHMHYPFTLCIHCHFLSIRRLPLSLIPHFYPTDSSANACSLSNAFLPFIAHYSMFSEYSLTMRCLVTVYSLFMHCPCTVPKHDSYILPLCTARVHCPSTVHTLPIRR